MRALGDQLNVGDNGDGPLPRGPSPLSLTLLLCQQDQPTAQKMATAESADMLAGVFLLLAFPMIR